MRHRYAVSHQWNTAKEIFLLLLPADISAIMSHFYFYIYPPGLAVSRFISLQLQLCYSSAIF